MKITRNISTKPENCSMVIKGFFGNVKGEVKYGNNFWEREYDIEDIETGYLIYVNGIYTGFCTNFDHACFIILDEMKIIKNNCG